MRILSSRRKTSSKSSSKASESTSESNSNAIAEPACAPSAADRLERVAVAAYYMAEARGFTPGYELEDWLAAEEMIDRVKRS